MNWTRALKKLAERRALTCLLVGLTSLGIRLAVHPLLGIPDPAIHDEFSYLLGADTLAKGRVANATHPQWMFFETFHVIHQPSYVSKYPPAQAVFLAVGQKIFGHPWFGVWLSVGIMCAAICWGLQGWLPPRWALAGAMLAVVNIGVYEYWMNSYWGGAAAAIGGALLVGAIPRLTRGPAWATAAAAALGLVILANSRPYEGAVLGIGSAISFLLLRGPWRALFDRRNLIAAAAVLALGGLLSCYYNYRISGNPLKMPYESHQAHYAIIGGFRWDQPTPAPAYNHEVMRKFWTGWEIDLYHQSRANPRIYVLSAGATAVKFYFGYSPLLLGLLLAAVGAGNPKVRSLAAIAAVMAAGLFAEKYFQAHYSAPAAILPYALSTFGIRYLATWRFGTRRIGRSASTIFLTLCYASFALAIWRGAHWRALGTFPKDRASLQQRLESQPENHLVVVRYDAGHNVLKEWVHNRADIDGSRVVWARDMGAERNRPLLEYFRDRKVWLLEPDHNPPRLTPYF